MNPIALKTNQLNQKLVAAMIEAILDFGDPCELAYPAWLAAHQTDSASAGENIILEAFRRLGLPESDGIEDPVDYVYGQGLGGLEVSAVLVINIDGRQFLVGEDYVEGKSIAVIREV